MPSPSTPVRHDIPGLTTLRGVFALWVVLYHFWPELRTLWPDVATLFAPAYRTGNMPVPGFFVLSGVVMVHTYRERLLTPSWGGAKTFLLARLARIYPVHLVTLLVLLGMLLVARAQNADVVQKGYGTVDFVLNVLLIHAWSPNFQLSWNYPSWSLSAEWFAYCLFPITLPAILRLARSEGRTLTLVGAAAFVGGSVAAFWNARPLYELLLVCPTFAAGAWIACLPAAADDAPRRMHRWVANGSAIAMIGVACLSDFRVRTLLLMVLIAIVIAALYRGRSDTPQLWHARPFIRLGDVSYSLYMTHILAKMVLNVLLPTAGFADAPSIVRFAVTCVYVATIALACWVSFRFVEAPARAALRPRRSDEPRA